MASSGFSLVWIVLVWFIFLFEKMAGIKPAGKIPTGKNSRGKCKAGKRSNGVKTGGERPNTAQPAKHPHLAGSQQKKTQVIENTALHITTGCNSSTPKNHFHRKIQVLPLKKDESIPYVNIHRSSLTLNTQSAQFTCTQTNIKYPHTAIAKSYQSEPDSIRSISGNTSLRTLESLNHTDVTPSSVPLFLTY